VGTVIRIAAPLSCTVIVQRRAPARGTISIGSTGCAVGRSIVDYDIRLIGIAGIIDRPDVGIGAVHGARRVIMDTQETHVHIGTPIAAVHNFLDVGSHIP